MVKWAVELSEHSIEHRPRPAIKAQALADFIFEMTKQEKEDAGLWWKLSMDGSAIAQGRAAGIVLETPQGDKLQYALKFKFATSNNEAEHEVLIAGGKLALAAGARCLRAYSDSQLVVNQVMGEYEAKGDKMVKYLDLIRKMRQQFDKFKLYEVPHSNNEEANRLAKLASSLVPLRDRSITILTRDRPETEEAAEEIMMTNGEPCWKNAMEVYLTAGSLPQDEKEAKAVRTWAARFTMIGEDLYKRG